MGNVMGTAGLTKVNGPPVAIPQTMLGLLACGISRRRLQAINFPVMKSPVLVEPRYPPQKHWIPGRRVDTTMQ